MTDYEPEIQPSGTMSRRSALRMLTLAGAGLFVGPASTLASDFFSSFSPAPSSLLKAQGIPTEWLTALGPTLPAYAQYLGKIKLRYLKVKEIIRPHTNYRGKIKNTLPPRAMWGNIRSTLKVLDALAYRLDSDVEQVSSVYRSPEYNARCAGGRSNSYHLRNNAVDIIFDCAPGKVAAMARAMRAAGLYKGGVGRYRGFTHVDTRGENVDW